MPRPGVVADDSMAPPAESGHPVPAENGLDFEWLGFSRIEQTVRVRAISGGRGFAPRRRHARRRAEFRGNGSCPTASGEGNRAPAPGSRIGLRPRLVRFRAWLVVLLVLAPWGCGGLSVREPWVRNAIEDREERLQATNQLSSATGAVLLRYDLAQDFRPATRPSAARILETKLEAEPVHDGALALAELSYQAGLLERSKSRESAIGLVSRRGRRSPRWHSRNRLARGPTWPSGFTTVRCRG